MKILIVDDDDFTTRLLQIQLRAMGLKDSGYAGIESSSSGADAIERLALAPADFGLVFCDLRMPGMDGVEFVRHLVATEFRGGLVLISGAEPRVLQMVEQLARQQGLDVLGSLAKPVTPGSLRTLLQGRESAGLGGKWADCATQPGTTADAAELEAAINGGEIVNHYQPKIDLRTGAVVGMEALARWQHPERGIVAPDDFLPLVESAGLVTPLTRAVLVNALQHACSWNGAGGGLDVAVNVSLASLGRLDFPDRLAGLAAEAGFPLERLVLELSESRLPTEPRAQLDILSRLRLKGVRLALDDFGTGFTKLAQLRDMPFSELKIDRAFVQGVAGDASRRAIVQAALALARELDVETVAEGVDNAEDLACLRALGCGMFQGYLVAEPMPACDVVPWLDAWPTLREGVLGA
ncbi:EAL domain-containing response regulator [Luteimonas sp. MC1782]|uniref:EAL domain-containing response regulator n=1 Tax=Luteimonas sp. MC1782 TaxID=2760305 RepID=UPI0015FFBBCE|nr:EAL domain-containing response regulator [Luteimonas sp. MC1782]MBB1472188.1 EAL domain-containing response regulator [Luteimonas sp. MC1782]